MLLAEGGTEEANVRPRITQIMHSCCSQSLAYSQVSPNKLFPLLCCRLLPCSCFQNRMHSYAKWARRPGPSILFLLETRILKINICSSYEEKGKNGRGTAGQKWERWRSWECYKETGKGQFDFLAHWLGMTTQWWLRTSSYCQMLSTPLYWQVYPS